MIVSSGAEGQVSDLSTRTRSVRRESRSVRSDRKKESQRQRRSPRNNSGTPTRNRRTFEERSPGESAVSDKAIMAVLAAREALPDGDVLINAQPWSERHQINLGGGLMSRNKLDKTESEGRDV